MRNGIDDYQLTLNGDWDKALLKLELADLVGLGVDLKILGFDGKALNELQGIEDVAEETSRMQ